MENIAPVTSSDRSTKKTIYAIYRRRKSAQTENDKKAGQPGGGQQISKEMKVAETTECIDSFERILTAKANPTENEAAQAVVNYAASCGESLPDSILVINVLEGGASATEYSYPSATRLEREEVNTALQLMQFAAAQANAAKAMGELTSLFEGADVLSSFLPSQSSGGKST